MFELNDKHDIGSECDFTPIDKKGSFRIADRSSGVKAEVKVGDPGKGVASWTNARAQNRKILLGDVQQAGACWSDGSTYICAWSLDEDVYLGPYDTNMFVAYGERSGMDDEIESVAGLDTSHAVIHTKPSRRAAMYYAIGQHDYTGVEEAYQDRAKDDRRTITADCTAKEWTGLNGLRYRFLGPFSRVDRRQFRDNGGVDAKWAVLDIKSNSLVGDCGACSYGEIHDWFEKLCPHTAPHDW